MDATPTKPKIIFVNIILRYTHSTWFSLSSQKVISEVYTCTTWYLCWQYHSTLHSHNLILTTFVQLDFKVLHLYNLKSLRGYYCTLHSYNLIFTTFAQLDFRVLHLHNLKSLSSISLHTTLAQLDFTTFI